MARLLHWQGRIIREASLTSEGSALAPSCLRFGFGECVLACRGSLLPSGSWLGGGLPGRGDFPRAVSQQSQDRSLGALDLLERALARRLVRPPAHESRSMAEATACHVVVFHLDHQLVLERLPFRRTLGAPA